MIDIPVPSYFMTRFEKSTKQVRTAAPAFLRKRSKNVVTASSLNLHSLPLISAVCPPIRVRIENCCVRYDEVVSLIQMTEFDVNSKKNHTSHQRKLYYRQVTSQPFCQCPLAVSERGNCICRYKLGTMDGTKRVMRKRDGKILWVCHIEEIFDIIGIYPSPALPFSTSQCFIIFCFLSIKMASTYTYLTMHAPKP